MEPFLSHYTCGNRTPLLGWFIFALLTYCNSLCSTSTKSLVSIGNSIGCLRHNCFFTVDGSYSKIVLSCLLDKFSHLPTLLWFIPSMHGNVRVPLKCDMNLALGNKYFYPTNWCTFLFKSSQIDIFSSQIDLCSS